MALTTKPSVKAVLLIVAEKTSSLRFLPQPAHLLERLTLICITQHDFLCNL